MDKNKKNIRKNTEESEAAKPQNTEKEPETKAGETVSNGDDKEENCELEDCKKQIEELKDKYLRQAAEFDNYRKRIIREKTELIQNGGENVINSLLPVIDDFERAIKNNEKAEDIETLKKGVELIYQKLVKALETNGLKAIETRDADFDTDYHEAVAMIPAPSDEYKGKVVDCVQKGYKLNDKVIRHAKVAVGQ